MKILVAVLGLTIVAYGVLTVAFLLDLPTAVACDRGRTDVDATPHTSWADASRSIA